MSDPETAVHQGSETSVPSPAPARPVNAEQYRRSPRDGERWLRTVAVTGGAFILFLTVSGQAVKNGDTAAWLSMLFNGVMATAAVGAYLTARKWVPQLTTQEGYKEAIILVNDHYMYLGKLNPLLTGAQPAMYCYRGLQKTSSHSSTEDYSVTIDVLINAILQEQERQDRIEQAEFRLRTYGLYDSPDYAEALAGLKSAFTGSIAAAKTLLAMLQADREMQKKLEDTDNPSMRAMEDIARILHARQRLNASTESAYVHLCRKWDDMVARQGAIFKLHPPVGELFSVRK